MYACFEQYGSQSRKHPNTSTENQNESLITHVPKSENQKACDEVGFRQVYKI